MSLNNPTQQIAQALNDEFFANDVLGGGIPTETEATDVAKTAEELGASLTTLFGLWEADMEQEYTTRIAARKARYDTLYGNTRSGSDNNTIALLMDKEAKVVEDEVKALRVARYQEHAEDVDTRIKRLSVAEQKLSSYARAFPSPLSLLEVQALSDARRATLHGTTVNAGPQALVTLARVAIATKDVALGAAVAARLGNLPTDQRPFSANELARSLVGETHAKTMAAYKAVKSAFQGSRNRLENFKTGKKRAAIEKVRSGLASHVNDADDTLGAGVRERAAVRVP